VEGRSELDELYQEIILDHYKRPRNAQLLEIKDISGEGINPFCGDEIRLTLTIDSNGNIDRVGFNGQGCAISQASNSILSELVKGKTIDQLKAMIGQFKSIMQGKTITEQEEQEFGELQALFGVKRFPIRIKCALLAWSTLQDALDNHQQSNKPPMN